MSVKDNDYKEYINRISSEKIPAYEPTIDDDDVQKVIEALRSGWISEGRFTRKFEENIAKISKRRFGVTTSNGTAALMIGMLGLGLKPGDDVIVPSLSHSADPNSIASIGLSPVFSDVDIDSFCLSVENIEKVRTKDTKAVLNVCAYGNSDDLNEIQRYCESNKLFLINDCAPALGCRFKGEPMSSYGNFSMHSFFADKTITMGEGGILLTDDDILIEKVNMLKHDGRKERGHDLIEQKGFNFRITEMQAALGVSQFEKFEKIKQKKLEIHNQYIEVFKKIGGNLRIKEIDTENIVPHRNILNIASIKSKNKLDTIIKMCSGKGIGLRSLFMPMHSQPAYTSNYSNTQFETTSYIYKNFVCLPSAPSLSKEQIRYVAENIVNIADRI